MYEAGWHLLRIVRTQLVSRTCCCMWTVCVYVRLCMCACRLCVWVKTTIECNKRQSIYMENRKLPIRVSFSCMWYGMRLYGESNRANTETHTYRTTLIRYNTLLQQQKLQTVNKSNKQRERESESADCSVWCYLSLERNQKSSFFFFRIAGIECVDMLMSVNNRLFSYLAKLKCNKHHIEFQRWFFNHSVSV